MSKKKISIKNFVPFREHEIWLLGFKLVDGVNLGNRMVKNSKLVDAYSWNFLQVTTLFQRNGLVVIKISK